MLCEMSETVNDREIAELRGRVCAAEFMAGVMLYLGTLDTAEPDVLLGRIRDMASQGADFALDVYPGDVVNRDIYATAFDQGIERAFRLRAMLANGAL